MFYSHFTGRQNSAVILELYYTRTRGHRYKLYKPLCSHNSRATFLVNEF